MRTFIALVFVTVASLVATPSVRAQTDIELRDAIRASVSQTFLSKNYALLEAQATEFRTTRSRTPSGLWKLTLFYAGIDSAISQATHGQPQNFKGVDSIVADWVAAYPDSPTAHIVQSEVLYYHAMAYRGRRPAISLHLDPWQPFRDLLATARANLEKHKAIASSDPQWYETMLNIGRLQNWEKQKFMHLLDEALSREPAFYQTYFAALDYLLPRWSGSIPEIEEFAASAAKRSSATDGSAMYARIYWYASQSQFGAGLFSNSMVRWPAMRTAFDDVIAKYPDVWNLNNFAKFACLANDAAKTKELLSKLGANNYVAQAWDSKEQFAQCQKRAMRN